MARVSDRWPLRVATVVFLAPLLLAAVAIAEDTVQHRTLYLVGHEFRPNTIEVVVDRPVVLTLTNDDRLVPHNLTLQSAEAGLDLDADVKGGRESVVRFTPRAVGSFSFFCDKKLPFMKSHRKRGMVGTLVVITERP